MHYGHPDVFDRVFHITRGGISKASRVINISEDIYSGIAVDFASQNFGCSGEAAKCYNLIFWSRSTLKMLELSWKSNGYKIIL